MEVGWAGDGLVVGMGGCRERFERRVSGRPGAEGAVWWREGEVEVVVRFVVEVGWVVEGVMRRDWWEGEGLVEVVGGGRGEWRLGGGDLP